MGAVQLYMPSWGESWTLFLLVCLFIDMEEHTDTVDFVIENPDEDLLMRIEEQISIQVAKTESDEESGEEGDPVMVTCGKLIISSPDKEEADEALDDCGENQHFALMSIEKVDDEDFEAVFEINSDMDEIGLSESDIKALELMESKEYIVLRDKTEQPRQDDFSSSVLNFQEAIENYTKSVFTGISDTMSGIEAKTAKSEPVIEQFSESIIEVDNKYAGRVPIVEETFEEVKSYLCGQSDLKDIDGHEKANNGKSEPSIEQLSEKVKEPVKEVTVYQSGEPERKESFAGLSPSPEEPFEEVKISLCEESIIIDDNYTSVETSLVEDNLETLSTNIIDLEHEDEKLKIQSELDCLSNKRLDDILSDTTKPTCVQLESTDSIIKISDIPNLLELGTSIEEIKMENYEKDVAADESIESNDNIDIIKEPVETVTSELDDPKNYNEPNNKETEITIIVDETFLENTSSDILSEEQKYASTDIQFDEHVDPVISEGKIENNENTGLDHTTITVSNQLDEEQNVDKNKSNISSETHEEKTEILETNDVEERIIESSSSVDVIDEDTETLLCNRGDTVIESNKPEEKADVYQPFQETEFKKYENVSNQGIQRNAESRKSKRNIKLQKPISKEEKEIASPNPTKNKDEMQLLISTILFVAFGIFLFLISGDVPSFLQEDDPDSYTRIPASVSGVIDGYVQLSSLSEVELRK